MNPPELYRFQYSSAGLPSENTYTDFLCECNNSYRIQNCGMKGCGVRIERIRSRCSIEGPIDTMYI